jgi:lysozyme family protein
MASFVDAHKKVGKSEGGYTNNPKDNGNWVDGKLIGTNYGISAPILKAYLGRSITIEDMKNLSPKTASTIYKVNYWDKIDGDKLKNQSVALIIYDASVNHGLYATKSMVKKALAKQNATLTNFDAKVINKVNQKTLFDDIYKERANRYANGNPAFREGWMRRLEEIKYAGGFTSKKAMFLALGVIVLGSMGYFIYKGVKK